MLSSTSRHRPWLAERGWPIGQPDVFAYGHTDRHALTTSHVRSGSPPITKYRSSSNTPKVGEKHLVIDALGSTPSAVSKPRHWRPRGPPSRGLADSWVPMRNRQSPPSVVISVDRAGQSAKNLDVCLNEVTTQHQVLGRIARYRQVQAVAAHPRPLHSLPDPSPRR